MPVPGVGGADPSAGCSRSVLAVLDVGEPPATHPHRTAWDGALGAGQLWVPTAEAELLLPCPAQKIRRAH